MKKLELLRLQKRIIVLAKIRNTGSVSVLASKLSVSDRTLKRIIKQVRDSGIPIYFDRRKESYRIDEF
ncbi:MAG TPA: HTH domain-containing protein [Bacteroidales bacterium]|nr:HTH domain-containing protein [Bacteroidales bacterium]